MTADGQNSVKLTFFEADNKFPQLTLENFTRNVDREVFIMATKKSVKKLPFFDFSPWNFVIFLVLGFVLITVVAIALKGGATQLGVQAGYVCPKLSLPDPRLCEAGWKVDFSQKCPRFSCNGVEGTPMPRPSDKDRQYPEPSRGYYRNGTPEPSRGDEAHGYPEPTGSSMRMRIPSNEPHVSGPSY